MMSYRYESLLDNIFSLCNTASNGSNSSFFSDNYLDSALRDSVSQLPEDLCSSIGKLSFRRIKNRTSFQQVPSPPPSSSPPLGPTPPSGPSSGVPPAGDNHLDNLPPSPDTEEGNTKTGIRTAAQKRQEATAMKAKAGGGKKGKIKYSVADGIFLAALTGVSWITGRVYSGASKPSQTADKAAHRRNKALLSGSVSLASVAQLSSDVTQLTNENVLVLALQGSYEACREHMVREVMRADKIPTYAEASVVVLGIEEQAIKRLEEANSFYVIPLGLSVVGAALSVPLVYDMMLGQATNNYLVHAAVEEPENLETMWEVSAWTWTWMEPALGVGSFVVLCFQMIDIWLDRMGRPLRQERTRASVAKDICDTPEYQKYKRGVLRRMILNIPPDALDEDYADIAN